jgi:hypothetical protein
MPPPKYYYFIEDLDVTADNIPDGVLVRQFKLNNNFITYKKNMFITEATLKTLIDIDETDKKHNPILVPNKIINDIKNKNINLSTIPRIIIGKKSHFASLLHKKNINQETLLKNLNNIFK